MTNLEVSKNNAIDLIKTYINNLQGGNVSEILKLYASNAEIIPEAKASLSNKIDIEDFYNETFASIKMHGDLNITDVNVFANVAIVRSEEPAEVEILASGAIEKAYFRELFVLTRESENEDWKIFKYMFSQIEQK
nr:hypothetical protein [uncultured Chryseobacterium sp.]